MSNSTASGRGSKRAKSRLDVALVERGLAATRAKAQSLIMARRVLVNEQFAGKPGSAVRDDDVIRVQSPEHPWVGRGGMKLAHALEHFAIDVSGRVCADIGASTGGFTDVLLKHGAAKVFAVDVGYGQLDASLRNDPRVIVREKVNARFLQPSDFDEPIEFVSIDVSFISLRLVLPVIAPLLAPGAWVVALVKPQFEAGKAEADRGAGVITDPAVHERVLRELQAWIGEHTPFSIQGLADSPIYGREGNREFLLYLSLR